MRLWLYQLSSFALAQFIKHERLPTSITLPVSVNGFASLLCNGVGFCLGLNELLLLYPRHVTCSCINPDIKDVACLPIKS